MLLLLRAAAATACCCCPQHQYRGGVRYRLRFLLFPLSATSTAVSFASILLLLLLLRRDMHFLFLVEMLLLLITFLVGCAAVAGGACAAYSISTEAERGTGYCFFLLLFCPLHCDASDVNCCSCSWLLQFLSFRLRCLSYGC